MKFRFPLNSIKKFLIDDFYDSLPNAAMRDIDSSLLSLYSFVDFKKALSI